MHSEPEMTPFTSTLSRPSIAVYILFSGNCHKTAIKIMENRENAKRTSTSISCSDTEEKAFHV